MKKVKFILKAFLSTIILIFTGIISLYVYSYFSSPIALNNTNKYILYDNKENIIFSGVDKKEWVDKENINPNMINAILSIEDKNFYKHHGFDYLRIIKTLFNNIISKDITGGASTISQQLVKNMYLEFDQTWERKIKEAFLTMNLEMHYSKDEILTAYLNTINFGCGNYGIENASLYYFNKHAKDITLEESLILAGIPKNPTNYNPSTNYDNAIKRANKVAKLMNKNNYIDDNTLNNLFKNNITIYNNETNDNSITLMYYQDAVINELNNLKIPKSIINSGNLKIYTSLDKDSQLNMENSIKNEMGNNDMQVASILIDPNTGEVLALTGGKNYNESQYNRILSSKRQVGSTMKPLLYYCALNNGLVSSSTFLSEKTTFNFANNQSYAPNNFNDKYANKNISMAAALSYSDNIYAVKTHLFLGEDVLVNYAKKLGITSKLEEIPSLALGTNEINMFEFAQAYQTLASGGFKNELHFIKKITDYDGNLIYQYDELPELINDPNIVYILNNLLTATYNSNFKDYNNPTVLSIASQIKNKYAVKTGTTDTDFWLVGYNKNALMLVWNGYDEGKNIDNKDYNISRKIWLNTIEPYLSTNDDNWYDLPTNVVGLFKNAITGKDEYNDTNSFLYYYVKGTQ